MIIAAIDGGGTKVDCIIVTEHGDVLGQGRGGPTNTNFSPAELVIQSLDRAIGQALSHSKIAGSTVGMIVVGSPTSPDVLYGVTTRWFPSARVIVVGEGALALAAGGIFGQGVAVISGTGSMAVARGPFEVTVGGWGTLLGDEGSAYSIGIQALKAVCRAADGRGQETLLTAHIQHWAGIDQIDDLPRFVYGSPEMNRQTIAGLAVIVTKVANKGDGVAQDILIEAGRHLADQANTAIRRVGFHDRFDVVGSGSVLRYNDTVFKEMVDRIHLEYPLAQIHHTYVPPALGGASLALQLLGASSRTLERLVSRNAEDGGTIDC